MRNEENLRKEDEREREEKKESSNDGEANPPSSNPTRVFLVEVDLSVKQKLHLLLLTAGTSMPG